MEERNSERKQPGFDRIPKLFVTPKKDDELMVYPLGTDKKTEEINRKLLDLELVEAVIYMFIADFILRHHCQPTILEVVTFIDQATKYQRKFFKGWDRMSVFQKVNRITRVINRLQKKGWLIYDKKIAGRIVLLGANKFIKYLEDE